MARCTNCKWRPGLVDEQTICDACKGTGETSSKKDVVSEAPAAKAPKKGKK